MVNAVLNHCKGELSGIGGEARPGIVHRIDKDTSGLLIIAKNDKAHLAVSEQIKNHEVKKTYRALVSKNDRTKMSVDKNGKNAVTHFTVLERFRDYTYIEVTIETGRTHQIRVHMSKIGFPIVGDSVYSNGKNPFGVEGQMLHSYKLEFVHPITKKKMELTADIPDYFKNVLKTLEPSKI